MGVFLRIECPSKFAVFEVMMLKSKRSFQLVFTSTSTVERVGLVN